MSDTSTGLHFRVLGSLEVFDEEGELVGVRGLRRRALLLRLLIDSNRVVPSDTLIEDVWSGRPPNDAVGTLQSHVSLLRRLLGPRLHSRRPGYLLSVGDDELDAQLFEVEVAQGRGLLERSEAAPAATVLLESLDRWRGQALLDVAGLPWALPTAVHLEQLRFNALELAAEALLLANRVDEAVALSRAAVEDQPLRERLWTHLMVGLARQGRQADALRAYQRARHHLAEQLGIEPSPSLLALEDAILMQRPIGAVWQPSATATSDPVLHVMIEHDDSSPSDADAGAGAGDDGDDQNDGDGQGTLEVALDVDADLAIGIRERPRSDRLVGRERELVRVQGALEAARSDGRLRTVVVTGAPGMGRTRFAREVIRQARSLGWQVLAGAFGAGDGDSGGPFEELRRELGVGPADTTDRREADRALVSAIRLLTEKAPVCVVLTEVQHADAEQLSTLRELLAQLQKLRVVVLLSGLGLDFHQNRGVSSLLWRLHREGGSDWIRLEALRPQDLRDLVREVQGTELSTREAERFHSVTGGNPMLAVEALRWEGDQVLPLQDLANLYTEQFVAVAGSEAIEAATIVAVFGDWVPLELVAELRSKPPPEVLQALDAAARVGIIEDDGRGSYRVTVPLVAGLLLNRVSESRRAMLHREIADRLPMFLPGRGRDVTLAVADHWLSGARGQDARRVYESARDAAGYALGEGDTEQALSWLGIAQRLSETGTLPTDKDRADLLYRLLQTRATLGYPLSLPLWREAFAAARATGDAILQARVVLCQPAWPWIAVDEPRPFAGATLEASMAALPTEEMDLRARLLAHLAAGERWVALTEVHRPGAGRQAGAVAREATASLGPTADPDTVLRVTAVAATALHGPTTLGGRLALVRRARRAARRATDDEARADALLVELTTVTELGDGAGAADALARLDQLAATTESPSTGWRALVGRAWRSVVMGNCEASQELLRAVREKDPTPERSMFPATYLFLASIVQRQTGQIAASRAAVEALGLQFPGLPTLRAERAACTAWLGDVDRAVALAQEALELSSTSADDAGWLSGRLMVAEVAIAAEHHGLAARMVEDLQPFDGDVDAGPIPLSRLAGSVPEHLGALLALLGDFSSAEMYLRAAVELGLSLQSPYHEARARLRWAQMLATRAGPGDAERSRELAAEVLALAEEQPQWAIRRRAEELRGGA